MVRELLQNSREITPQDDAGKYLISRIGKIADFSNIKDLRFHPDCGYFETNTGEVGRYPALLGVVKNERNKIVAVHRTYLKDGKKADVGSPKKVLGKTGQTSFIQLFDAAPIMGIAEGIETALSCAKMFKMPVWAVCGTSQMESFIPPECVERLYIFSDNDRNFAGQKSAYTLAHKLSINKKYANIAVFVSAPSEHGKDFNDILNKNS